MSTSALGSASTSPTEQPRTMPSVPGPNVHLGWGSAGNSTNGLIVRLLPVQMPSDVPVTDQLKGVAVVFGFLGGTAVLPMIRKRQSLNAIPLRRPATHSTRHLSNERSLLGPGTEFAAKTKSRSSPLLDRP